MRQKGKPPLTVVNNYKKWAQLQAELGQTVLKFAAHPDCTLQQLWLVKMQYAESCNSFNEMRKQLRDMYWDGSFYDQKYPWNQPLNT